jgi:predicted short-subunit dehydrogenase-like oxidoreductase (DUF2520 family)
MKLVIIGTGNTATILGRKLKGAGHQILQVFGRDAAAASHLAYELNTESTNYWTVVRKDADVYLIAVSDDAIQDVVKHLYVPGKVVAHTAASVKQEILKQTSPHYGIFYPLQSLHKDIEEIPEFSVLIDASDDHTKKILELLAKSISNQTATISEEDRLKLHVAAVICNNFTNYLYLLAEEYCRKEKLDFTLLYPLIQETADRVMQISPSKSQTGPAVRHDDSIIREHLDILKNYPELKKVYQFLSDCISSKQF